MKGYINRFDIAEGLMITPFETIKELRNDDRFRKNSRIMELIKMLLEGFRKWMRIAIVSGLKGLNPFCSNKNAVDTGYYDYKKTDEFKQLRKALANEMGISDAYTREDIIEKYAVIKDMFIKQGKEKNLKGLELNSEGFFFNPATGKTYDVLSEDQVKEFEKFSEEHPKYNINLNDIKIFVDGVGKVVVEADNALIRAFLEKEYLGRDKHSRSTNPDNSPMQENSTAPTEATESGPKEELYTWIFERGSGYQVNLQTDDATQFRFCINPETQMVILDKYMGKEPDVTLPKEIVVEGIAHPVSGITGNAFMDSSAKTVTVDVAYWDKKLDPACFRSNTSDGTVDVVWDKLSTEQKQQLAENKEWAEKQQLKKEEREQEPRYPEQNKTEEQKVHKSQQAQKNPAHQVNPKHKDRGMDI